MGCSQSANANITPTGDGITALVWSPDWVADTLISRGPQFKGSRESKMWKNQVAIFDKLLGKDVAALPFLPDSIADTLISRGPQFVGSRESKMWKNQVAIFGKLLGDNALSRDAGVDVAVIGSA